MADLVEKISSQIKASSLPLWAISEASGVPASTIKKIKMGVTTNPRYQTLRKLEQYFAQQSKER